MRRSATLTDAEILARIENLENMLGVGQVLEPGAATITPSSATQWEMAPGTSHTFYDNAGIARVILGLLPSGDYGLQVTDPNGVANEIWPVSSAYSDATVSTTSATPVSLAGSPEVTCYIGASGDCLISASAAMACGANTDVGNMFVQIDGTGTAWSLLTLLGIGGFYCATTRRWSEWIGATLTPNTTHTFALQFAQQGTSGDLALFENISLLVQPL